MINKSNRLLKVNPWSSYAIYIFAKNKENVNNIIRELRSRFYWDKVKQSINTLELNSGLKVKVINAPYCDYNSLRGSHIDEVYVQGYCLPGEHEGYLKYCKIGGYLRIDRFDTVEELLG